MNVYNKQVTALRAAILTVAMLTPTMAWAACCPSDGNTSPKAARGLGESTPAAADAAWQIYEFERDGVRYTQINDSGGNVRAAVGRVEGVFWVMPIRSDTDRVSVQALPAPSGQRKVLYRTSEVEVVLHRTATGDYWEVRQPAAAY